MKSRIFSKTMAIVMALALVIALVAIPASAATSYTAIGGSTTITKNLVVDSDANIPDVTFNFTITRGTPMAATSSTVEIMQSPATASIGTASFTNADTSRTIAGLPTDSGTATAGKKYAQKAVTVTFPVGSFTKPGVYRYVIQETAGSAPGVTYDTAARYLDVFVIADANDALSVQGYVLRNSAGAINSDYTYDDQDKSEGFTNTIEQYDFSFSKAIEGNQGDKNKQFTFTLGITNAIPGTYPIEIDGASSTITVGINGTYSGEFELTDGSTVTVKELNAGAICTVSEDAENYTATHSIDSGSSVSGDNSGAITINTDRSVAFTNTLTGVLPTGVLLTIAPFAIGLLLFGALALFLISRRRRENY